MDCNNKLNETPYKGKLKEMNWKETIKDKAVEIIIAVIVIPLLLWGGSYLKGIYESVKHVPELQTQIDENWQKFVDVNTAVAKMKWKMHDDSVRTQALNSKN